MPLETATYISDLVVTNPASTDGLGAADDHARLIKSTLLATFPNIDGEVTATPDQLNNPFPIGGIIQFYSASVPTGWQLCDGSTVARSDGAGNITAPDLRGLFVRAAGPSQLHGTTGGSATAAGSTSAGGGHTPVAQAAGGHDHGGDTEDHTLTTAEIPAHTHTYNNPTSVGLAGSGGGSWTTTSAPGTATGSAGGGGAHSHGITAEADHTHTMDAVAAHTHTFAAVDTIPPYYALTYIMKY